jgi:translocation and assembly module TamB
MKKARKYALRFLSVVVSMALLVFAAAQTTWVRQWLKGLMESAVSDGTNGVLSIHSLGGTLFGDVSLEGVTLTVDGDTLARLEQLEVRFSLWDLLSKEVTVHDLRIERLDARINRDARGLWNIDRLAKPAELKESVVEDTAPSAWGIHAEQIRLLESSVVVGSRDSSGAGAITVRNLALCGTMELAASHSSFRVDSLCFSMRHPDIELRRLTADAVIQDGALIVRQAEIATAANVINLSGQYGLRNGVRSNVAFSSGPLQLSEIPGLPSELKRDLHPVARGAAELAGDDLSVDVILARQKEQVRVSGTIEGLSTEFRAALRTELQHLDVGAWFPTILPPTDLSGVLDVRLTGLEADRLNAGLSASFARSRILDRTVDTLIVRARLQGHALEGTAALSGRFGSGRVEAAIRDVRSFRGYDISLDATNLDLSAPLKDERATSDLSVKARVRGEGVNPKNAAGELALLATGTIGKDLTIDSLTTSAEFNRGKIRVRDFTFVSPDLGVWGRGEIGPDGTLSAKTKLNILNPERFALVLGLDSSIAGTGTLDVAADGNLDTLVGRADFALAGVRYDTYGADSLLGSALVSLVHGDVGVSGPLAATGLVISGIRAEKVEAVGRYGGGMIDATASLRLEEGLSATVEGNVELGDTTRVVIPSLAIEFGEDTWTSRPDTVVVAVSGPMVELSRFVLRSGAQSIHAGGKFDSDDSVDIVLAIDQMDIGPASKHMGLDLPMSGTVNASIAMTGAAASPSMRAKVSLRNIVLAGVQAGEATLEASARDSGISWDLGLVDLVGNRVLATGRVPYQIGVGGITLAKDSSIAARLETSGYDVRWIRSLSDKFEQVAGRLTARLDLSGYLSRPSVDGMIALSGGALSIPSAGLDVRDFELAGRVKNSMFTLDSLSAHVGGGLLKASGTALLPFATPSSGPDSAQLIVSGRQLAAKSPRKYEVKVDTDLRLSLTSRGLDYSGTITVPESRIFLQGILTAGTSTRRSSDRPMLVQMTKPADSLQESSAEARKGERRGMPIIGKQTNGRLTLSFPKNTWIQSPNINAEFYGDLNAFQTDSLLELEGTIKISRGTVQLLGKRFQVRDGRAEFSRGPRINPAFVVELEYRFRDANRQERSLIARLTGNLESPNMIFALDEKPITQQDAISYLIFGRSVDELTLNQQSSVSGNSGAAGSAAFDMLGAQLSNVIAQRVGLDVVEIKSTDGAKAGTLTAGKYITEGVFVSYEKGFGEYGANETIPEVFTIEYELIRSLFLQFVQANDPRSGADIIFKIQ